MCCADRILCLMSLGIGVLIIDKRNKQIGYIDCNYYYLGDDIIIDKIVIFKNKKLSDKLTEKYKSKILILNYSKDCYN